IRKNHKLMRVCYAQAVNDPDFQAFWAYRMNKRRTNMRRAVELLHREGKLADGWSVDEATDWLFTITDFHTYEQLVVQSGWTAEQLSRRLLETVFAVLVKGEDARWEKK